MPLTPGTRLGPYEILAPIGAGGMGEVYKARDIRLNRIVAIKCLKPQCGARFEQEARAIAALNHPHICQIHDIGPDYLVLEFVEGVPLQGPLSAAKALPLALEIASALEAAHKARHTVPPRNAKGSLLRLLCSVSDGCRQTAEDAARFGYPHGDDRIGAGFGIGYGVDTQLIGVAGGAHVSHVAIIE